MRCLDVLKCTLVCKSKKDAIVEEDTSIGVSSSGKANVDDN